ncbi:MAG: SUMF1/EgtB/PvdO family nonheme iron enzyme [Planctomycetes bacterium]|nr:SUMF1/EgtB/PvdO family nonheme iron enzyme [Planctomycetota bacterium]
MDANSSRARSRDRAEVQRATLLAELRAARARTDDLFARLRPDGYFVRAIAERHRLIFYLGHLEAFDWNLLGREVRQRPPRNAAWERLFAFGIDPVDGQLPSDTPADWPDLGAVRGFAADLRAAVDAELATAPFTGWLENGWALRMAIEHRAMHAETLAYLLQRVPLELKLPGPLPHGLESPPPPREMVAIPAGRARLGKSRAAAPHDGWDNEYEAHEVAVPAFRIARHAVTNAEWLEFVTAGGYADDAWWTPADAAWRRQHGVTLPAFWRRTDAGYCWQAMFGSVPLPLAWPVWVSLAEARAFARWRGQRLPTEAEWHRAALGTPAGGDRLQPWGDAAPVPGVHGNFGFAAFDPAPVDAHPRGQSAFGVHGLVGNGWQWTDTVFAPFAGFTPLPFYRGYSANFFDGKHFVMKGASPVTEPCFLRPSFRNWFQPHYPYVFAGFRCVAPA